MAMLQHQRDGPMLVLGLSAAAAVRTFLALRAATGTSTSTSTPPSLAVFYCHG